MRVTTNNDKMTRLSWLVSKLDPEHGAALMAVYSGAIELSNQSVPPVDSDKQEDESDGEFIARIDAQNEAIRRLEDFQVYARMSIKTLEEIPPAFGTLESELGHAFIWHITPQGEQYWLDVHGVYGERRFKTAMARAKEAQEQLTNAQNQARADRLKAADEQQAADEAIDPASVNPAAESDSLPAPRILSDEDADMSTVSRSERDSSAN